MGSWIAINLVVLWIVVLGNAAITAALVRHARQASVPGKVGLDSGTPVPDFEATTATGQEIRLSDFSGQRLMLFLLSPTCQPCIGIIPAMRRFAERVSRQGARLAVVVLGSVDASRAALPDVFEDGLTVLLPKAESSDQVRASFRLPTPGWCAVSERGTVIDSGPLVDSEEYWSRLEAALTSIRIRPQEKRGLA